MVDYDQTFTAFTPEIWSQRATHFFLKRLVAAKHFLDYSDEAAAGADVIHIPKMSDTFTATAVTATSGRASYQELSDTTVALTLNQWYYNAFPITDLQKAQMRNPARWINQYVKDMGYALAAQLDTALLALGASVTNVVADSANDLTATDIEDAIAFMDSSSIPLQESAFMLHPNAYWKEIVQSSKLVEASKYGKVILPNAPHNELYGIPVYLSANVPSGTAGTEGGHRNLLVHGSTFAYAMTNLEGPKMGGVRVKYKEDSSDYRSKIMADIAYGTAKLNLTHGTRIISYN